MATYDEDIVEEGLDELDEAMNLEQVEHALHTMFYGMGLRPDTYEQAGIVGGGAGVCIRNQVGQEFRISIHASPWNQ